MRSTLEEPGIYRQEGRDTGSVVGRNGLRARFFGDFEVLYGGEALYLGRNKRAVSLFKYLLARHPHPVSRDSLMGWLWSDSSLRRARWSLNSAVYDLRKTLAGNPVDGDLAGLLLLEAGRYRLPTGVRVSSDVAEFEARRGRGRALEDSGQTGKAVREYEEAVGLYRGEYLIEDLYEDWTIIERERLSSAYLDLLERLAEHYVRRGDIWAGAGLCYRVLEKDPRHEESHRRLMRCYARLGLRERAARQYELCARVLERLGGLEPAAETRDLYRCLLRGEAG